MNARHLIALILIACPLANAHAKTYANRTFMMPRASLYNMALEQSTWHRALGKTTTSDHKSSIQVSTLYQHSTNSGDLGKYFGYFAPKANEFRDYINVVNSDDFATADAKDNTWSEFIIHNVADYKDNLSGKIQFRPTQEIFSTRLDFYTDLSSLANNLFLQISMPITSVKNSLRLTQDGTLTPITMAGHPANGKTLLDYFKGNVSSFAEDAANQQLALTHAKMENGKSHAGIADVETKLGLALINNKNSWLKVGASMVTPTGNRPTGEFIFEPICGNGQHWEFGGFVDTKCLLWKNDRSSVSFLANASCSYGLEDTEKRTLGIQKNDGTPVPFSQYYVVGQKGVRHLFPFANISTQDLKVTPGVHCQALANLAFTFKNVAFDCGYNLFAKQHETVQLKNAWNDGIYAIAQEDYTTDLSYAPFLYNVTSPIQNSIDTFTLDHTIDTNNVNLRAATSPSQITHKFYGAISHTVNGKNPILFGLGAAYEFCSSNTSIDAYSAWLTANLAF